LTHVTSSVLDALGIEPDDLVWQDLAVCDGLELSRFYEGYETSERTAKLTDQICLSCPVRKECLSAGIENSEYGVWGGIYLTAGKADEAKNAHKTNEIRQQLRQGIE
jgi:hypothetical protein